MKNLRKSALLLVGVALVAAACSNAEASDSTTTTAATTTTMAETAMADIVDTAVAAGQFNTLAAALTQAGLVDTLKGERPFTVFAPTDAAFEQALADLGITAEQLLADPNLAGILTYHVVPGKVLAADVVALDGQDVATVNGATVRIAVDGGTVMVNDATVVTTDVEASNGVIHVIDKVLLPPS